MTSLSLSPALSLPPDNRECIGETPIEQSEFCHYDTQGACRPLAKQILEGFNISAGNGEDGLCTCRFRRGRFVCDPGKSFLD